MKHALPRHVQHAPVPPAAASPGRRAVLVGGLAAAGAAGAAAAGAVPAAAFAGPVVHSTAQWGARSPRSAPEVVRARPTRLVIHHMASPNTAETSLAHAYGLARACQQDHMGRGFDDSGQHFTVSRGGHCLEGRAGSLAALRAGDRHVKGAHVSGQNTGKIGIECEGSYVTGLPTPAQYRALVQLAAHICRQYGIRPADIVGHGDLMATQCPGGAFHARLGVLRADVARTLATGRLTVSDPSGRAASIPADPRRAATTTPSAAAPASRRVLGPGSRGADVKRVQALLTTAGHRVPRTGLYAARTTAAVRAFQRRSGLAQDGFTGPLTWAALEAAGRR